MTMNFLSHPVDYISTEHKSRDTCVTQADSTESWRRPCDTAKTSISRSFKSSKWFIFRTLLLYSGGFSGLYNKFGAYQKWYRTTLARAQFYEKTLEMADLITNPDNPRSGKHREQEKAEISQSEQAVVRVIDAVKNTAIPFTIENKERLYCLASGAPVPLDVETDVLQVEAIGIEAKGYFVDVLKKGEADSFFFPINLQQKKSFLHHHRER